MHKFILNILFFLLIIPNLYGQTPKENLDKYWAYRQRFLDGFIRIGLEKGESIPIAGKSPHWECNYNYFTQKDRCSNFEGLGILFWSDSAIELGNYISTLALIIRNLKDAKQPYEKEAMELFYAIKAFERLDHNAETFFGKEPKLDGFFIRDDVPGDFAYNGNEKKFASKGLDGYSCLMSHGSCKQDDVMDGGVASVDQIMALFLGFTFVGELIPEVKYKDTVLSELSALQVHRVASSLADNKWKIVAPNGEVPSAAWGGNTIAFSYAIAACAERLTKGKYRKKYQTGISKRRGKLILDTFNWAYGIQAERNHWMAFSAIVISDRWNAKKMAKRTKKSGREMFALAYSVINDVPLDKSIKKWEIEKILNSAPIDGPCINTPDCNAPKGWKNSNKWIDKHGEDGNPYGLEREFNGTDYMMLYNLYHYLYRDALPRYMK